MSVNKLLPTANVDGTTAVSPTRTGKYGEAYALDTGWGRNTFADEGSYYVITNATIGTQLTGHVAPAIADTNTKSIIHFFNGGTSDIYLDYLVLTTVVANASATAVDFLAWTDNKGATGLTSGGTAITANGNTRSNSTRASGMSMTAGACVTAPTTNVKKVLQRTVKPYIGVALDSYSFVFGNGAWVPAAFALITAVTHTLTSCAPVVVGPGGNFYFVQTGPSGATTAMTFEFEMGYVGAVMQATFTLATTTFAAPVSSTDTLVTLASLSGINLSGATNTFLFANRELLVVQAATGIGNQVLVKRGCEGTASRAHGTGETVYVADAYQLFESDPQGLAPLNALCNPHINIFNGKVWVIVGDDEGPGTQTRSWQEVITTNTAGDLGSPTPGALGVRVTTTTTPT